MELVNFSANLQRFLKYKKEDSKSTQTYPNRVAVAPKVTAQRAGILGIKCLISHWWNNNSIHLFCMIFSEYAFLNCDLLFKLFTVVTIWTLFNWMKLDLQTGQVDLTPGPEVNTILLALNNATITKALTVTIPFIHQWKE